MTASEPQAEPTSPKPTSRRGWVFTSILVFLVAVGGLAGLLAVLLPRSNESSGTPALRANDANAETEDPEEDAYCPCRVATLDDAGFLSVNVNDLTKTHVAPCLDQDDPQQGHYLDWTAPMDGEATVTAWSFWVDPTTCACGPSVQSRQVQAGETLRVWARLEVTQPIRFEAS